MTAFFPIAASFAFWEHESYDVCSLPLFTLLSGAGTRKKKEVGELDLSEIHMLKFIFAEDGGGMRMKMPDGGRPRMTSGSSIAEDAVDQLQASEKLIAGKAFIILCNSYVNTYIYNSFH